MSMETMTIQDLARVLADRKKLEPSVAQLFVATMFDVVRQALGTERIVKVKGLGTFKLVGVSARESVNVNNGERVLIESHDKITFTPDSLMKELVNKPFSQFETVILNDGVEFDDLEADKGEPVPEPEISADENEPEAEEPDADDASADDGSMADEDSLAGEEANATAAGVSADEDTADEQGRDVVEVSVVAVADEPSELVAVPTDEPQAEPEEPSEARSENDGPVDGHAAAGAVDDSAVAEENAVAEPDDSESAYEAADEGSESGAEVTAEETEEVATTEPAAVEDTSRNDSGGHTVLKWTLLCVVVLALMTCSGYIGFLYGKYMSDGNTLAAADDKDEPSSKQTKPAAPALAVADTLAVPVPTDTVRRDAKPQAAESKPATDTKPAQEPQKAQPGQAESAAEAFDSEKYERMDSRIRYGAYRIIGTDKVVTVKAGQTIGDISDRHLGPGMECYVETYNGLSGDIHLKAGQKIKIPKLQKKKRKR